MTLLAGVATTPERSSAAVQLIVTSPLYQPLAFGAVVGRRTASGAVLSTLMPADGRAGGVAGGVHRGALERLVGALTEGLAGGDAGDAGQAVRAVEVRR